MQIISRLPDCLKSLKEGKFFRLIQEDLENRSDQFYKVLIYGETFVGKTFLTAEILKYLVNQSAPLLNYSTRNIDSFSETEFEMDSDNKTGKIIEKDSNFSPIYDIFLVFDFAPRHFFKNGKKIGGKLTQYLNIPSMLKNKAINQTDLKKSSRIFYFNVGDITPPRSTAKDGKELLEIIENNYYLLNKLFEDAENAIKLFLNNNETEMRIKQGYGYGASDVENKNSLKNKGICVVINDVGMFFHKGTREQLKIRLDNLLNKFLKRNDVLKRNDEQLNILFIFNGYIGKSLKNDYGTEVNIKEISEMKKLIEDSDFSIKLI